MDGNCKHCSNGGATIANMIGAKEAAIACARADQTLFSGLSYHT